MASDDELRRVAEDVRALARSLSRDIRAALDRASGEVHGPAHHSGRSSARDELRAAGRAARHELRQAQLAVRHSSWRHQGATDGGGDPALRSPSGPDGPPRWDNWGRRHRGRVGTRPGGRAWSGRPGRQLAGDLGAGDRVPVAAPLPPPPLRHRHDGTTLLGLVAVVFGLAWLVAGTHVAHVSTEAVVAVALMVVGATTVVTARTDWALSRRSWPLVGGAALAVVLLGFSASPSLPVGFRHLEFGSRTLAPLSWAEVPATIHGGFGKTVVDLTALPAPTAPRTLEVDSAAGRLEINLPANLRVLLAARVSAGQMNVNHVVTSGVGREDRETLNPTAPGPPLTLHVQSGFGSLAVEQLGVQPPIPVPPAAGRKMVVP